MISFKTINELEAYAVASKIFNYQTAYSSQTGTFTIYPTI